jgi:hypothetical protein
MRLLLSRTRAIRWHLQAAVVVVALLHSSISAAFSIQRVVDVLFENRSGAILDLLGPLEDGDRVSYGRIYPGTGMEISANSGETISVGVAGVIVADYTATKRNERVSIGDDLLEAFNIMPTVELTVVNAADSPRSVFLLIEEETPELVGEMFPGERALGRFPAGSLLLAIDAEGTAVGHHVVLPLENEIFELVQLNQP